VNEGSHAAATDKPTGIPGNRAIAAPLGLGLGLGRMSSAVPEPDCGDFGMRIAADGTWYHEGAPIRRLPLVKLFASVLRREADGTYWLVTPVERGRIAVEDAPFVAVEMQVHGEGRNQILTFRTNLDDTAEAGESHPIRVEIEPDTEAPHPYVLIKPGLEARLSRAVFYQLVELASEEPVDGKLSLGVWSRGRFFPLGNSPQVA
jgi:uncharacterized protein